MYKSIALSVVAVFFAASFNASNASAEDFDKIVNTVPAKVSQILSGGFWKKDDKSGPYRAVVINSGTSEKPLTLVYLQWLATGGKNKEPEIVKSVPIKQVSDKKLANAFVYLEGEDDGTATLIVTSYDPATDKDTQIWLRAAAPGSYKEVPAETDGP